jgi:acetyl-CoA carboxylase carboxyl transferase subunit beta
MPEGLWLSCPGCEHMVYKSSVEKNMHVCTQCNHHFRIGADLRIKYLVDEGTFEEELTDLTSSDPLDFKFRGTTYKERLKTEAKKSGVQEAIHIGKAFIKGRGIILAVMDPNFLMGSMGAVVGEKFFVAAEMAIEQKLPLVAVICSGGARMHESVIAVQQMAKTSAAIARLNEEKGLYIAVLTDPTTGGVTASFAMLGDITIAEPGALIGFTGRRVIAETIKVELPEGFQTAEFMLDHGFVDMIVERKDLRSEIARLIDYCKK